jgi:O-antigen ligase
VLDAVWQKPFLGYGYSAATSAFMGPLLVGEIGSAAVDAHNGYLDVLLGTGMVGLVALAFCMMSVIVTGIDRVKTSAGLERDFFMLLVTFPIMSLLNSCFEMEGIRGVETFLGALTFLSLTAVPLYLRHDRGNYRSPTTDAHTSQSLS